MGISLLKGVKTMKKYLKHYIEGTAEWFKAWKGQMSVYQTWEQGADEFEITEFKVWEEIYMELIGQTS